MRVARALPSADLTGPTIAPGTAPGTLANLLASMDALTRSAGVMPESRLYTMTPEKTLGDWKRSCACRTAVDSALAGSQALASFFSAPVSLVDSGKARTRMTSQKPTTTHLVQL